MNVSFGLSFFGCEPHSTKLSPCGCSSISFFSPSLSLSLSLSLQSDTMIIDQKKPESVFRKTSRRLLMQRRPSLMSSRR